MCTPCAASAFDASAFTPNCFVSCARRSRRGPVTYTCDGGTRCLSRRPRIMASAMVPPPMNARRFPCRGITSEERRCWPLADDTDEVAALEQPARLDADTVEGPRRYADIGEEQLADERSGARRDETTLRQRQRDSE